MHSTSLLLCLLAPCATLASKPTVPHHITTVTHTVSVGANGLRFGPEKIKAAKGDKVEFIFHPQNHSVVQSTFAQPCAPKAGGFFSGYFPTASGINSKSFTIDITTDDPIWFYCSQAEHCEGGMVGVINEGSDKTLDEYGKAASKVDKSSAPSQRSGGSVGAAGKSGGSSASPSSTGTASGSSATATSSGSTSTTSSSSTSKTSNPAATLAPRGGAALGAGAVVAVAGYMAVL